jgi:hypothetical protein
MDIDPNLDPSMLRSLGETLSKAASALVRGEGEVTRMVQAFHQGKDPERGIEVRVADVEFAGGVQQWPPTATTGPGGAYYYARSGYLLDCWAPANFHIIRHWHPDAHEYMFVREGEALEVVSGRHILAGEGIQIITGQTHEILFLVPTTWTHCFGLMHDERTSGKPG